LHGNLQIDFQSQCMLSAPLEQTVDADFISEPGCPIGTYRNFCLCGIETVMPGRRQCVRSRTVNRVTPDPVRSAQSLSALKSLVLSIGACSGSCDLSECINAKF
jgi:hypothetical protein